MHVSLSPAYQNLGKKEGRFRCPKHHPKNDHRLSEASFFGRVFGVNHRHSSERATPGSGQGAGQEKVAQTPPKFRFRCDFRGTKTTAARWPRFWARKRLRRLRGGPKSGLKKRPAKSTAAPPLRRGIGKGPLWKNMDETRRQRTKAAHILRPQMNLKAAPQKTITDSR